MTSLHLYRGWASLPFSRIRLGFQYRNGMPFLSQAYHMSGISHRIDCWSSRLWRCVVGHTIDIVCGCVCFERYTPLLAIGPYMLLRIFQCHVSSTCQPKPEYHRSQIRLLSSMGYRYILCIYIYMNIPSLPKKLKQRGEKYINTSYSSWTLC